MRRALSLCALGLLASAAPAWGQGYRLRLDARVLAVSYQGLTPDSIPAGDVVTGPTGGPVTPDGIAVRCGGGSHCYFFRPGPERRGLPLSLTGTLAFWGTGVTGLSFHLAGRLVADAGDADAWPATEPPVHLLEGYAEYQRGAIRIRGGRLLTASRLEPLGFDGGWLRWRWSRARLEATAYAGFGLDRAVAVPITSPALNPLDEWRPRERQQVAGGELAWTPGPLDARLEYRREVDPETDAFVSERIALSWAARPLPSLLATGGGDYNLAEGHLGSADVSATWLGDRVTVTAGARRHRPYFSLWTLWGAFSPVPYHAVHGGATVSLGTRITLEGRGERFWYADAQASSPLVPVEDRGWRVGVSATIEPRAGWAVRGGYSADFGPGAASRMFDAGVSVEPSDRLRLSAYGGVLARPLELRSYLAETGWVGGRVEWRHDGRWRLWSEVTWLGDARERPDAAVASLDQLRVRAGTTLTLGSGADRVPLPPGRPRQP